MVKKKTPKKNESSFDKLARLIKSESDDVRGDMSKTRFDMNEGFVEVRGELRSIRTELADISHRLDRLEQNVDAMRGYSKEIDEVRSRVKNIEKHLGIAR